MNNSIDIIYLVYLVWACGSLMALGLIIPACSDKKVDIVVIVVGVFMVLASWFGVGFLIGVGLNDR